MGSRLELQDILEAVLASEFVYFQPPPSVQMTYPCIVYHRSRIITNHAANQPYSLKNMYMVTVIDRDPDSIVPSEIAKIPGSSFDRYFAVKNLNHNVFTIHF